MRSPSSLASAASTSRCASASWVSPAMTKSVADSLVSGMSCATCARRQCAGNEKSPASSCSMPFSSANRLDLPAPLRPTRPIFSPGLSDTDALSSSTFAPRRNVRFFRMIMQASGGRESRAKRKPDSTAPAVFPRPIGRMFTASTRRDGFPSGCAKTRGTAATHESPTDCFVGDFLYQTDSRPCGTGIAGIQANPSPRRPS